MKKTIAAVAAGILLVAGQAAAQNYSATVRVGDRIGATAAESSEFQGVPLPILILGGIVAIAGIVAIIDDTTSD
jgi:hypothetical protein